MASSQNASSSSQSTSFSGINDPQALAALQALIQTLASGGTEQQQGQASAKKAGIEQINAALGDYKKSAAFQDALDLVTASLDKAMLTQKPAITRAVQGAGTSAASMQGLLAANAAEGAATQAGALGAEQAKSYGQITANLLSTLMQATSSSDPVVGELLKALDLSKVSTQQSTQQSTSTSASSGLPSDPPQQQQGGGGGQQRITSGGPSGGNLGSSSGGGLFDGYDPYQYSSQPESYAPQYSYDSSGAPVPTFQNGTTTIYGTDPNKSGYMRIENTTNNNSYPDSSTSIYSDPHAGNYEYEEYSDPYAGNYEYEEYSDPHAGNYEYSDPDAGNYEYDE